MRRKSVNELTEHPRAGGDDERAHRRYVAVPGTPPRGRGRLRRHGCERRRTRNTPARAGTTIPDTTMDRVVPEHPRAGGDDRNASHDGPEVPGTPPRGRGRRGRGRASRHLSGNTPARAETTPVINVGTADVVGTPPRGRGTTPTGADGMGVGTEHPRAGGDDRNTDPVRPCRFGTPPRGRGRHVTFHASMGVPGTPPRGRGTTWRWRSRTSVPTEHPRAGGDDSLAVWATLVMEGTPPRAGGDDSTA